MKTLPQSFNTTAQDSNLGPLSRETEALPLSLCALQWLMGRAIVEHSVIPLIFNVHNRLFNNINEMILCTTEDCPGHFCVLYEILTQLCPNEVIQQRNTWDFALSKNTPPMW